MILRAMCTECAKRFRASEELAGRRIKCSDCGAIVQLPSAAVPSKKAARSTDRVKGGNGSAERFEPVELPRRSAAPKPVTESKSPAADARQLKPSSDPSNRIRVHCGTCGQGFKANATEVSGGKRFRCPKCGDTVAIPDAAAKPAAGDRSASLLEETPAKRSAGGGSKKLRKPMKLVCEFCRTKFKVASLDQLVDGRAECPECGDMLPVQVSGADSAEPQSSHQPPAVSPVPRPAAANDDLLGFADEAFDDKPITTHSTADADELELLDDDPMALPVAESVDGLGPLDDELPNVPVAEIVVGLDPDSPSNNDSPFAQYVQITASACGVILMAIIFPLFFFVTGLSMAPLIFIARMGSMFPPNMFRAAVCLFVTIPLTCLFPFHAIYALILVILGHHTDYTKGIYGALAWIKQNRMYDSTFCRMAVTKSNQPKPTG